MYSSRLQTWRGKCVPADYYHKKQSNMYCSILVSLFKGHTSIPQI